MTQFTSEQEQADLVDTLAADNEVTEAALKTIKGSKYGASLTTKGVSIGFLSLLPVHMTISYALGLDPLETAALIAPTTLYLSSAKYLHPLMHMPREEALKQSGPFMRWLLNTRYVEMISRQHYMHHKGGGGNYNFVFGADWVMNQIRRPQLKHVFAMRRLGMIGAEWDEESP